MNIKLIIFILLGFGKIYGYLSINNKMLSGKVRISCDSVIDDSSSLMDGNIQSSSYVILRDDCSMKRMFVEIVLVADILVSHVIIYPGECNNNCDAWDFFVVKISDFFEKRYSHCGEFPNKFGNYPMRVNCRMMFIHSDVVTIEGNKDIVIGNKMVHLSEVEVYVLGSHFFGCYKNISGLRNAASQDNCFSFCAEDPKNVFLAFKNGHCYCLRSLPVLKTRCAKGSFEVYTARLPWLYYDGCYPPPTNEDLIRNALPNLTPVKCIKFCAGKARSYSYLQKKNCICDKVAPKINQKLKYDKCLTKCEGSTDYCGGDSAASLYSGCFEDGNSLSCADIYQCENENFNEFGVCNTYCNRGWEGTYCLDMKGTEAIREKVQSFDALPAKQEHDYNINFHLKHSPGTICFSLISYWCYCCFWKLFN